MYIQSIILGSRPLSGVLFSIKKMKKAVFMINFKFSSPFGGFVLYAALNLLSTEKVDSSRPLSGVLFSISSMMKYPSRVHSSSRPLSGVLFSILMLAFFDQTSSIVLVPFRGFCSLWYIRKGGNK